MTLFIFADETRYVRRCSSRRARIFVFVFLILNPQKKSVLTEGIKKESNVGEMT
jgi:hypothetical protein